MLTIPHPTHTHSADIPRDGIVRRPTSSPPRTSDALPMATNATPGDAYVNARHRA